jgi:hypothetical protein
VPGRCQNFNDPLAARQFRVIFQQTFLPIPFGKITGSFHAAADMLDEVQVLPESFVGWNLESAPDSQTVTCAFGLAFS